jgi:hypothetical protein
MTRTQKRLETKPGTKTTEFWSSMAVNAAMLLNLAGVWNFVPNRYSVIVIGIVQGLYSLSRGQAKQGVAPEDS